MDDAIGLSDSSDTVRELSGYKVGDLPGGTVHFGYFRGPKMVCALRRGLQVVGERAAERGRRLGLRSLGLRATPLICTKRIPLKHNPLKYFKPHGLGLAL